MKKILFLFIVCTLWFKSYSQNLDIGFGYSSSKIGSFDIGIIKNNGFAYYFEFGGEFASGGIEGEDYTGIINWNEYNEDHRGYGEYYQMWNFGIGHTIFEKILFVGVLGYANKSTFVNSYDSFHILGDNGYYYIRGKSDDDSINIGAKLKYFIDSYSGIYFSIGINAYTVQGVGINLGIGF